jgi:hypothetical protein
MEKARPIAFARDDTQMSVGGIRDALVTEILVSRWLLILGAVALIALIAGYVTFGGANMGR